MHRRFGSALIIIGWTTNEIPATRRAFDFRNYSVSVPHSGSAASSVTACAIMAPIHTLNAMP
jgi:hypothetical protein